MITRHRSLPSPWSGTFPGSLFTWGVKAGLLAGSPSTPDSLVLPPPLEPPLHVCWAVSLRVQWLADGLARGFDGAG